MKLTNHIPSIDDIKAARKLLNDRILTTPCWEWRGTEKNIFFGQNTKIFIKLELLQYGGSFKPRGALINMLHLAPDVLRNGVTAISAGNHAIAVSYAAKCLGINAKVVIPKTANPFRVERCKSYGADIVFCDDFREGFNLVQEIAIKESRKFIHPFEGYNTVLGTSTLGLEFSEQVQDLDAIIVAIGGGGLIAGVSTAFKYLQPNCKIFGVEPKGASVIYDSIQTNKLLAIEKINTIADSLGSPKAEPYTTEICKNNIDRIELLSDQNMLAAMKIIAEELKMMVEPACSASLAGLLFPFKEELQNKRVGILFCGSNIGLKNFCGYFSH